MRSNLNWTILLASSFMFAGLMAICVMFVELDWPSRQGREFIVGAFMLGLFIGLVDMIMSILSGDEKDEDEEEYEDE